MTVICGPRRTPPLLCRYAEHMSMSQARVALKAMGRVPLLLHRALVFVMSAPRMVLEQDDATDHRDRMEAAMQRVWQSVGDDLRTVGARRSDVAVRTVSDS